MPLYSLHSHGFRCVQLLVSSRFLSHVNSNNSNIVFQPKRVLLLAKVTRYEFERSLVGCSDEHQIHSALKRKGVNVDVLLERHKVHRQKVSEIQKQLCARGVEVQVVNRVGYTADAVNWADVVLTAGGDGTFLLGAHKIRTSDKLIIGLNTDPDFSAGVLCLPKWCTTNFSQALDLLYSGRFRPFWRNRIRVTMIHDKEHVPRIETLNKRKSVSLTGLDYLETETEPLSSSKSIPSASSHWDSLVAADVREHMMQTTLPIRALNEVYVGENLSARVSNYDISIDGEKYIRQRSSGVTCATGTGSSSWFYQINRLSNETVANILDITKRTVIAEKLKSSQQEQSHHRRSINLQGYSLYSDPTPFSTDQDMDDVCDWQERIPSLANTVAEQYNASIPIPPDDVRMAYVVRDPLCNSVFNVSKPRGLATQIQVRSTMLDAHVVFDAGWTYPLHYGAVVSLSIYPSDALCCVHTLDSF